MPGNGNPSVSHGLIAEPTGLTISMPDSSHLPLNRIHTSQQADPGV